MRSLALALLCLVAATCSAQSPSPTELVARRLAAVVDTNASFAIGLTTDGGQQWRDSVVSSELVEVTGRIRPEAAHIGRQADIFLVDQIGSQFIMFTTTGGVQPWNGQTNSLVPFRTGVTLSAELQITIYKGRLGSAGVHRLFIGYRSDDGVLIYTPSPKTLTFTAAGAGSTWQPTAADRVIKHPGFDLRPYDPLTNRAGDVQFTQAQMSFNRVFFEYGFTVPANSVGPEKKNPQPTFILPLGTKVRALIDGTVASITKLYSNDYSVMLQASGSTVLFELEHVINVQVAVGERVTAGQVVAEVSNYDAHNYDGMGLFEIGVLKGGDAGPPLHYCPFDFLDPSARDSILSGLDGLMTAWEQYRGDSSLHPTSTTGVPGCLFFTPIEG